MFGGHKSSTSLYCCMWAQPGCLAPCVQPAGTAPCGHSLTVLLHVGSLVVLLHVGSPLVLLHVGTADCTAPCGHSLIVLLHVGNLMVLPYVDNLVLLRATWLYCFSVQCDCIASCSQPACRAGDALTSVTCSCTHIPVEDLALVVTQDLQIGLRPCSCSR